MKLNFENRTAIVTGGSGALGSVVASKFLDAGANIAIPVRSKPGADGLRNKFSGAAGRLLVVETDLSVEEDVQTFVRSVEKQFGTIDFVANIAGGYAGGNSLAQVPLDEWESMMTLNLKTTFLVCREVLRPMLAQDFGRIINIAAMPVLTSGARKGPYAISKRGVIALTETISDEVKGTRVTANAIAPSIILTDANKSSMPSADTRKWVTPEEIADLILFLCSDSARSISRNTIRIFGRV